MSAVNTPNHSGLYTILLVCVIIHSNSYAFIQLVMYNHVNYYYSH